jgi:glycine cleavage system H lipoate-binding protein
MFPGVNGFHWTFGHILFLSLFGLVATLIGVSVLRAVRRAARDVAKGQSGDIAWRADFQDLPVSDRCCRHQLSGRVDARTSDNAFDCATCPAHLELAKKTGANLRDLFGLQYPSDRLYHRGHTWVHAEEDGSYTVGLDDLVARIIGKSDSVSLPAVSTLVQRSAVTWTMKKNGHVIRVRSPLSGTVVETGSADRGWFIRIKPPAVPDLTSLLTASEAPGWLAFEIARLERLTGKTCLSDGVLVYGLMDRFPEANWDGALGALVLHP